MRLSEKEENGERFWQGKKKNFKVVITELIKETSTKYVVNIIHNTDDIKYHSHGIAGVEPRLFDDPHTAGAFADGKIDSFLLGDTEEWHGKGVRLPENFGINEDEGDYRHDVDYEALERGRNG